MTLQRDGALVVHSSWRVVVLRLIMNRRFHFETTQVYCNIDSSDFSCNFLVYKREDYHFKMEYL